MSFGSPPATQTTINDPYSSMPDWVKDYYQNQIARAEDSDVRIDEVRQQLLQSGFIPDYAGDEGLDLMRDAAARAAAESEAAMADSTRRVSDAADRGDLAVADVTSQTEGALGALAGEVGGVSTDLGSAFDTRPARDRIEGIDPIALRDQYMNPYLDDVLDPTLARMREDEAMQLAALEASGAAVGGASNSRLGVQMARMADEGIRSRAQVEGEMRSSAFRDASQFGLQAGELNAQLANMAAQLGLSESELEAQIRERSSRLGLDRAAASQSVFNDMMATVMQGEQVRFGMQEGAAEARSREGVAAMESGRLGLAAGAALSAEQELARRIRQEQLLQPLTLESLSRRESATPLAVGLPNSGTQTSVQTGGGPSPAATAIGGITALTGLLSLSDERVKEDVVALDGALDIIRKQRPSVYSYSDPEYDRVPIKGRRSAGLMARDLLAIPGAVVEGADGLLRVDPYPVMTTIAAAVQELDRKMESISHGRQDRV